MTNSPFSTETFFAKMKRQANAQKSANFAVPQQRNVANARTSASAHASQKAQLKTETKPSQPTTTKPRNRISAGTACLDLEPVDNNNNINQKRKHLSTQSSKKPEPVQRPTNTTERHATNTKTHGAKWLGSKVFQVGNTSNGHSAFGTNESNAMTADDGVAAFDDIDEFSSDEDGAQPKSKRKSGRPVRRETKKPARSRTNDSVATKKRRSSSKTIANKVQLTPLVATHK